jgi:hypothetical protein
MTAVLRTLGRQPHGAISLKACLDFYNYAVPGLMDEAAISERIMRTMRGYGLKEAAVRGAIDKGFAAAKGNRS